MAYWGELSYGVNEDIIGVENAWTGSGQWPACWRAARDGSQWRTCMGNQAYGATTPCGQSSEGSRLRGNLDRIWDPGTTGLFLDVGPDDQASDREPPGGTHLLPTTRAEGPYLGDVFVSLIRAFDRVSQRRHPNGAINVLFADMHGAPTRPVAYTTVEGKQVPSEYAPRIRISPYQPHQTN